jgi:hypothetical protein
VKYTGCKEGKDQVSLDVFWECKSRGRGADVVMMRYDNAHFESFLLGRHLCDTVDVGRLRREERGGRREGATSTLPQFITVSTVISELSVIYDDLFDRAMG